MNVILYTKDKKNEWDSFIQKSKNGTFMLMRNYVEYHANKFKDFSLMFYEKNKLIALLPASLHGNELNSHGGLTYGGIISDKNMTVPKMLEIFKNMKVFLKGNYVQTMIYKCVPRIYHRYCADEDLYALFINNAVLFRRDISTCVCLNDRIPFSDLRKRGIKKAQRNKLIIKQSFDFDSYIDILTEILNKYHNAKPVHTAKELNYLAKCFPDNIKLFAAYQNEIMLAGVVVYETENVVHTQYIANSDLGRSLGALDFIIGHLISLYSNYKKFFDFGISTENLGRYLNIGLINQKEMFGGRGIVYDFYRLEVN